ncbi:MAG: FG-GAP-like repeat-containing protein, partial [Bacteroidota bacterium]
MKLIIKNGAFFALLLLCQFFSWQPVEAQNVSYVPLNSYNDIASKPIYTNKATGAIQAEVGNNGNGAFTYSIPIGVPPGTNGVAPQLAIAYNSMGGNGILGQGWTIGGLSSITRGGQSVHFDGKRTPVTTSSSDRFYLDGSRLTLRSGTYGANGATYRKENDDFSVITSYANATGGPTRFEVETKDGVIYEYGGHFTSKLEDYNEDEWVWWKLSKIRYPDGNYIEFRYLTSNRHHRINTIKYTGNDITGLAPYHTIQFHYKTRTDQVTTYEDGSSIANVKLLDRIEVKAENSTFKNYYFRYSYDNYRSTLNSVEEKGSDGTALNTTIFKYGGQPVDFSTQTLTAFQGEAVDLFSGDFDGDGYTDILTSPYAYQNGIKFNTAIKVYKRTSTNSNYSLTFNQTLSSQSTVVNGMNIPNFHNLISSDFNGDGRDDIMTLKVTISGSQNWRTLSFLRLYRSTGSSFSSSYYFAPSGYNIIHPSLKYFYPGDFNGDGITDFIMFLSNASGYKAFITLGGTNYKNVQISGMGSGSYPGTSWVLADDIRVLDFDGDGKMELMKVTSSGTQIMTFNQNGGSVSAQQLYNTGFPNSNYRMFFGDFNGDQKTDMLIRNGLTNNNGTWYKCVSTGKGFLSTTFNFNQTPDIRGQYSDDKLEIGDFNGDGKTDIMHGWTHTSTSTLGLYFSTGNSFFYETENFNGLLGFVPTVQYDLNGDGRTDIINRTSYTSPSTILYFQKDGQDMLLQNITDGHGKRTNFSYKRMTQTSNFYSRSPNTSYPQNTVTAPIYLGYQIAQQDGIGGYLTTQYKYVDAYVHRAGRGFVGFREFHTIDLDNNVRTELQRNQTLGIYYLSPYRVRKYVNSTNYLYNRMDYNRTFVSRPNKSYWLRINGTTDNLYLQGQTKTMDYTYDSHGNITQEVEDNGVETITTNTTYGQYAGPVPNRPTQMTVIRQRTGQPSHTFSDRYYYNSKGQMTSRRDYYGLSRQVTTAYGYNNLGNVTTETLSASGVSSRTTTKGYDSKGRFVTSLTNPMGYTETATYDPKWGEKLSVTGVDGLTSTFQYDAFGRRTKTTLPTGVIINESYPFFISSSYNSVYRHAVTQTGKPDQWVYFDKLGRKVRHQRRSHSNALVSEIWTFDSRGRLKTVRAPYKSGETTFTTTYNYDSYNRRTSEVNPFGTTSYSYSYSGGKSKITKTNPAGQVSTVETDASDVKTKATDSGGTLTYTYDSQGLMKQVKLGSTTMVTLTHDVYGNKTQVVDKNAGTLSYGYNAFKEKTSETNANSHTYNMEYNKLGQPTRRYGPGEDRRYVYYSSGVAKGKLFYIYNTQSIDRKYYYYDSFGRVRSTLERIDGPYLSTQFTYNAFSDLTSKTYPSGLKLDYAYDSNGLLSTIKHTASNHTLFTNQGMNGREQYTSYKLGNNATTTITYNQGIPTRYYAVFHQDLRMSWNYSNGNLVSRHDVPKGRFEVFTYDNLNRLKTARVSGQPTKYVNYASNGNITSKTDVGSYTYSSSGKNNAVIRVSNSSSTIPTVTQDITYTQFDQPSRVSEGNFELDYVYGHERQRIKSVLKENGTVKKTRLYMGDFERQTVNGVTKDIHYVNAGQGTVGIVVKNGSSYEFYST